MKVLVIVDGAPYGTATPAEAFRTMVGLGGMDVDTSAVLVGDGVFVALRGQNPKEIDMQDLGKGYETVGEFGVRLYVLKESLEERGIAEEDLIKNDGIVDMEGLRKLIDSAHCVMTFVSGG